MTSERWVKVNHPSEVLIGDTVAWSYPGIGDRSLARRHRGVVSPESIAYGKSRHFYHDDQIWADWEASSIGFVGTRDQNILIEKLSTEFEYTPTQEGDREDDI